MKAIASEINRVLSTQDYSIFKVDDRFRFSESKLKIIIGEMAFKNLSKDLPIIVDENYNVLDGKYRLEAAKKLALPVHYKVAEVSNMLDLMKAKNVSFKPTNYDFIIYHQDKIAYRKLLDWAKALPYSYEDIGHHFGSGICEKASSSSYKSFINGEFEWNKQFDFILNKVGDLITSFRNIHKETDLFSLGFALRCLDGFDFDVRSLMKFIFEFPFVEKWAELDKLGHPLIGDFQCHVYQTFLFMEKESPDFDFNKTHKNYYNGELLSEYPDHITIKALSNHFSISPQDWSKETKKLFDNYPQAVSIRKAVSIRTRNDFDDFIIHGPYA